MYLIEIKNGDNKTTLPRKQRLNARVTKPKNKSDSFTFEVTNEFDKSLLKPFTTSITVVDEESRLFRGRIISDETDIYNFGIVECEGALSFLNDTFYPPFEWKSTPEGLLQSVLDNHNANVEDAKKIYLGSVTVTDSNNYLAISSEDYLTSLSVIQDKLIDKLGGNLIIRYEDNGTYLDYLTDILRENSQTIELGKNLLDVSVEKSYDEIITRLIPLGAKDEETGKYLDITSLRNGKNYIDNTEAIEQYGIISGIVHFDDITISHNLLNKANAVIKDLAKAKCTITIKAVDLNMVDKTYEKFKLGDWIKTIIPTHGINEFYQLNQIEYFIDNPEDNIITLGDIRATNTSTTTDNIKDINEVMNSIVNPNKNTLMATKIAGVLNLMNASLRAQKNEAQKQDIRAILFEDLDPNSTTFGAMCLGTQGIQISKKRNDLNNDWVWGTAIDFQTVYADYILTGVLSDKLGNFYLDMDTGELVMKNGTFKGDINTEKDITVGNLIRLGASNTEDKGIVFGDEQMTLEVGTNAVYFEAHNGRRFVLSSVPENNEVYSQVSINPYDISIASYDVNLQSEGGDLVIGNQGGNIIFTDYLNEIDVFDDMVIFPGQSISGIKQTAIGYVSSSRKSLYFYVDCGKAMSGDISTCTIRSLKLNIRIVEGGYVGEGYVEDGYNYVNNSNYTITAYVRKKTNGITIKMDQNVTYGTANNTPVAVDIQGIEVVFA